MGEGAGDLRLETWLLCDKFVTDKGLGYDESPSSQNCHTVWDQSADEGWFIFTDCQHDSTITEKKKKKKKILEVFTYFIDLFYIALSSSRLRALIMHVIRNEWHVIRNEWLYCITFCSLFFFFFFARVCSSQLHLVVAWLMQLETAVVSVHVLSTPYNHVSVYSVSRLRDVYIGCKVLCA